MGHFSELDAFLRDSPLDDVLNEVDILRLLIQEVKKEVDGLESDLTEIIDRWKRWKYYSEAPSLADLEGLAEVLRKLKGTLT